MRHFHFDRRTSADNFYPSNVQRVAIFTPYEEVTPVAQDWFVLHSGKETGPYTVQQMKQMAATGKLAPGDLVRRGDMKTPSKASSIKGLFATVAVAPAKPSSPPVTEGVSPPSTQKKSVPSKKTLIIASVVGGALLFMCCGACGIMGFIGNRAHQAFEKELAEADALWQSGKKSEAVAVYRAKKDSAFLEGNDRAVVYGRMIDYEYESGDAAGGKGLIDEADKKGVTPAVNHADAKAVVAAKQAERAAAEANKKMAGKSATIKHDRYTQVIMPDLPPECVHDKEEGELEKDIGEVAVPDISKVDFLKGPNGEPIEMVKYFEISKLEGGPEKKVLRQYGYLYRNKAGKNVYHGPWRYVFDGDKDKKESETIYVHGAVKCEQSWDVKGRPLSLEIFKSDDDHTQVVTEYYDDGTPQFQGQFVKVRYIPTKGGHTVERVPDGLHYYYWEQNGRVRQEELYENGQQTGIAIYDLSGNKVLGKGKLGS